MDNLRDDASLANTLMQHFSE